MSSSPLAGMRVIDMSWVVAGPMIGRTLADFGATVVRVESAKRPDPTRAMGPQYGGKPGLEMSAIYQNMNAGKLGLTLNLSKIESREVVLELVQWGDILIESFAPGQMARWKLDYPTLRDINPAMIMVSTSLAGQTGPWSSLAGFGNVGAAFSSFQSLVGYPGQPSRGPIVPYTDFLGPRFALLSLLAAIDHRRRFGEGCYIDVSQIEAGLQFLGPQFAQFFATGDSATAIGNADLQMAPHGVYACREGDPLNSRWIAIAVRDDLDWARLAEHIGGVSLRRDARFEKMADRLVRRELLDALLGEWTSSRPAQAIETLLQADGIPAHVVASSSDMAADPHVAEEEIFRAVPHETFKKVVVEAARYCLSRTPAVLDRPAPRLGEHNHHVLQDLLGFDDHRIAVLKAAGALS